MKADNKTTSHNRYIRLTEIPGEDKATSLEIEVKYRPGDGSSVIDKAVMLDSTVIPLVVGAVNAYYAGIEQLRQMAAEAYAESVRLTWKPHGRSPRLFRKTIADRAKSKVLADALRLMGDPECVYELAVKRGLLTKTGDHPADPKYSIVENLSARTRQ